MGGMSRPRFTSEKYVPVWCASPTNISIAATDLTCNYTKPPTSLERNAFHAGSSVNLGYYGKNFQSSKWSIRGDTGDR